MSSRLDPAQPDKLVVSQEDRQAAGSISPAIAGYIHMNGFEQLCRAFAAHRQRAMNQAAADEREAMRTVFLPAILHGDETHRAWLTAAVDAYLAGDPVPPPTGKGTAIRERTT